MVLAAGLGTRMRPLTLLRAKPVLPVLNRPLLHWTLEALARAGVREVVVNLHHLPGTIRHAVGDGSAFGLRVLYSYERAILGSGGGPRKVRRFFGDEPALLVNGDMAFDFDLRALVADHLMSGAVATLALQKLPRRGRYHPIVTDTRGRVVGLRGLRRLARGRASLFTGVQVLDPSLLERLPAGASDSMADLYAPLVREGAFVRGVRLLGPWYDLSDPALYLESQQRLMALGFGGVGPPPLVHPQARVHSTASVQRSVVGAASVVEAGARVVRSVLWEGVRVGAGARVEDTILADGVEVAAGASLSARVVFRRPRWRRQEAEGLRR
jgi:mannose-1-phosphate guanylyltransferase